MGKMQFLNVKSSGAYSSHRALNGYALAVSVFLLD
jgi:hypothetical protein